MSDKKHWPLPPRLVGMVFRAAMVKGLLRGRREAILARLEELGRDVLGADGELFGALFASGGETAGDAPDFRDIGDFFGDTAFVDAESRRQSGSFYTPVGIIDAILDLVWDDLFPGGKLPGGKKGAVCDPAMGCGYFLIRIVERLCAQHPDDPAGVAKWVRNHLYGVDSDPVSVFLARVFLWLTLSTPGREFIPPAGHLVCGDSLLGPAFGEAAGGLVAGLSWSVALPEVASNGGFGAIVGNPPYEVLTNFSRHPERRELAAGIRKSGYYRDALSGQINLYRCFVERSLALLRPGGALAMVVPLSLARDAAAAPLRRRLIGREAASRWMLYGEKERVFAGVTQSACIFGATRDGGAAKDIRVIAGGEERVFSPEELERFGGEELALPLLDRAGFALWGWLRENCAGTIENVAEMRVGEVDQTFFRDCMHDDDTGCLLARGAHLVPFRLDVEPVPGRERFLDLPLFLAKKGGTAEACRKRAQSWRVAQLGIRNMQSLPRLAAALVPPGVYLGNSLNVYSPHENVTPEFVAGVLNSRLLDWLFRIGSGNNNINLREMKRLPFPAVVAPSDIENVAGAYRRCESAVGNPEALRRERSRLDAAVEACFGVPKELLTVLDD